MSLPMWPLSLLAREMLEWYCEHWDFKATFKLVNSNVSGSFPRTRTKLFIQSTAKLFSGMNLAHSNSFSPWMVLGHSTAEGPVLGAEHMQLPLLWRINEFTSIDAGHCSPAGFGAYSWVHFIHLARQNQNTLSLVPRQTIFFAESHRFEANVAHGRDQN